MRGFSRPLNVARAARSAIACIAAAPFAALLATPLAAQASPSTATSAATNGPSSAVIPSTSREVETAMLRWGGTVVWFHATDGDSVLVFASAGFRNPFTHPITLSSDDADRWAAVAERLAATTSAGSAPRYQSPVDPLPDTAHMILGAADVILESTSSRDGVVLRMTIGANRQDGLVATLFPDGAAAAAAALHDAARSARSLHSSALAEAAAAAIPTAAASVGAVTPTSPNQIAAASSVTTPTPMTAPAGAPSLRTPPPPIPAESAVPSGTHPAPIANVSITGGTPAVARTTAAATTHHHSSTRSSVATSGKPSATPPNAASQTIVGVSVHTATPTLGGVASSPAAPGHAASNSGQVSAVSLVAPTPGLAPVVVSATSVPATGPSGDRGPTGVGDVTVRNLVHQWQSDLMYCYTEYGVRSHPDLVGTMVVRMTLATDGSVGHPTVVRHSWAGGDAADVENCIRNRVAAWHFPPASSASVHEFALNFAR